jgi:hypothetical protein
VKTLSDHTPFHEAIQELIATVRKEAVGPKDGARTLRNHDRRDSFECVVQEATVLDESVEYLLAHSPV